MKLLLDINVVLDVVLAREPWAADSARLLAAVERGDHEGWVAAHTVTTVHYLVARARGRKAAALAVADLLDVVGVAAVGEDELRRALLMDLPDFEDGVQAACAQKLAADALVTRDPKRFGDLDLTVLDPGAAL
ncbi:MAG: PIN domain-containing protein [Longimicrobiales bacterium]